MFLLDSLFSHILVQAGAWGTGSSSAVKAPPPQSALQAAAASRSAPKSSLKKETRRSSAKTARGGGRGGSSGRGSGRGGGGSDTGGGRHGGRSGAKPDGGKKEKTHRVSFKPLEEIALLNRRGLGSSEQQKAVQRLSMDKFLSCRMQFLSEPTSPDVHWQPHEHCHWTDTSRLSDIQAEMDALWNYEPLQVNDETRWKAKVMRDENGPQEGDSEEERLRKAFAILNKLSWTTMDRLTVQFLEALGLGAESSVVLTKETVRQVILMIVDKAMLEPHFAELYARFSAKITSVHKVFRKTLLGICQELFEETDKEPELPPDMDPLEREFELNKSRQKSIGLMSFIGQLYQMSIIKGHIMIECLQRLMVVDDEERLECFAKLMTTIGNRLHDEEDEPEMKEIWGKVYSMAGKSSDPRGPKAPSTRIKFLLQDLIELKNNDWVLRRKEEKAKTIAQIHKEVAEEEQKAASASRRPIKSVPRSQSAGGLQHRVPVAPRR